MYDPFGYYKAKNAYALEKNPHVPFYEDYPVNDSQWFIGETYLNLARLPVPNTALDNQIDEVTIVGNFADEPPRPDQAAEKH